APRRTGGRRTPEAELRQVSGPQAERQVSGSQAERRAPSHQERPKQKNLRVNWHKPRALGQTLDRLAGQRQIGHQESGQIGSTAGTASIWQGIGHRVIRHRPPGHWVNQSIGLSGSTAG
ncbi:unnamed protein product, partial [Staurois parvus]